MITAVDDSTYDELTALIGQRIMHVAVWEESLADALAARTVDVAEQTIFDIDLYLEDGVYFELYGVACFDDPDAAAWRGLEHTGAHLAALVRARGRLEEIAVDEDDGLVLILAAGEHLHYLVVGAWLIDEWDELPEG